MIRIKNFRIDSTESLDEKTLRLLFFQKKSLFSEELIEISELGNFSLFRLCSRDTIFVFEIYDFNLGLAFVAKVNKNEDENESCQDVEYLGICFIGRSTVEKGERFFFRGTGQNNNIFYFVDVYSLQLLEENAKNCNLP